MEIWKEIDYPNVPKNMFMISSYGRFKNTATDHIYSPFKTKFGYYSVRVNIGNKSNKKTIILHRAVARAFIENKENFPVVNHIDGNKANNNVDNLEWCTYSHNELHKYANGLCDTKKFSGERNGNHKLTAKNVLEIRNFLSKNFDQKLQKIDKKFLSKKFKISEKTVQNIWEKKTWKSI